MLSAGHVLAMDAKNLLDVVDGIRMRFPHVNTHIVRGGSVADSATSGSAASSAASSLEKRSQSQQSGEGSASAGATASMATSASTSEAAEAPLPSIGSPSHRAFLTRQ